MKWTPEVKKRSDTVRRIIGEYFLTKGKRGRKRLSFKREQAIRRRLRQALEYLDQNALELGDHSLDILKVLGPPYGRMAENFWLYPAEEREHFYVLSFVADAVADKSFTLMYDVETGR
jgi:hypothetical protein